MKIISSAFGNNQTMPTKYTCDGEGLNPPLEFLDIPEGTKSLALICFDPDAPSNGFAHWVVFNLNPDIAEISEGQMPTDAIMGKNSANSNDYAPPCPPSGTHHYIFTLYALDEKLSFDSNSGKDSVEAALQNHILEKTELIGLYQRR